MSESGRSDAPAHPSAWWSPADVLTAVRVPLAIAFVLLGDAGTRIAILALASATDFADATTCCGIVAVSVGVTTLPDASACANCADVL